MRVITLFQRQIRQVWARCVEATQAVLSPGQVKVLDRHDQVLRMLSGEVWVSVGEADVLVKQGEAFRLPADADKAVITGLSKSGVAYEIFCETEQDAAG